MASQRAIGHATTPASPQAHGQRMVGRQAAESALYQFDTDAVGCGDIAQPSPPDAFLQGHGKTHPLSVQLVAEGAQVTVVAEAEVIGPPGIVAGVISVRLYCSGSRGSLTGPLAPNDQGLATKLEEDLGGTACNRVGHDICTKHLHVPVG